jgi:hypothetical protein
MSSYRPRTPVGAFAYAAEATQRRDQTSPASETRCSGSAGRRGRASRQPKRGRGGRPRAGFVPEHTSVYIPPPRRTNRGPVNFAREEVLILASVSASLTVGQLLANSRPQIETQERRFHEIRGTTSLPRSVVQTAALAARAPIKHDPREPLRTCRHVAASVRSLRRGRHQIWPPPIPGPGVRSTMGICDDLHS